MTRFDGPISTPPTLRIEELFVALLTADETLADLPVVAGSDRDALVPPLHCFVFCSEARPLLSVGQHYWADVLIIVASNIDDNVHADRKAWATKVLAALTRREPGYTAFDSQLIHWRVEAVTEVSEGQNTGDAIKLLVAARVAAG
jgi:hypothetical protein